MNILAEKYRPKKREDIVGNKNTIDSIFALADTGKLTHMIFEGPPGVGKTTTAHVLARQMFGEFFQSNFLELNASDSRKVDDVRSTIKTFSKTTPFGANFKICLLDEGDEMTSTAQNALRRTMEQYSEITIFIFAVNNAYKMIDAIQSRCQMFHFGPLSLGNIVLRLINIYKKELDAEGRILTLEEGLAMEEIAKQSYGDMRKAINLLQTVMASGVELSASAISVFDTGDFGKEIFEKIRIGRFLEARKKAYEALQFGYGYRQLLKMLHKVYIDANVELNDKKKAVYEIAEADYRLTLGVDPILALDKVLMELIKL